MNGSESPAERRAKAFAELCELDQAERRRGLARLAAEDAALAADVERMLELDDVSHGPIEGLRDEVAGAARRRLLAEAAVEAPPPERLGPWRLGEKLGAGGMGEVFLGERDAGGFEQHAAVKIVRAGMASPQVNARFLVERQVLARLDHPAIARLFDGGVAPDGRPWFAMERVVGVPITEFVRARALDLDGRIRLLIEVAQAVEFAHRSLVVHRDLKPSNILVTADGRPKLLDFGLAKLLETDADPGLTRTEMRVLTPAYAAPEQVLGEPITTAVDVYALGVLLYELLTGELPHRRAHSTAAGLAEEISRESVERPSARLRRSPAAAGGGRDARRLEGDLDTIALRALAREPARRYASVAAFAEDLRRHLDGRPVLARPDTVGYRAAKFLGRHRIGAVAAALVFVSLSSGLAMATIQGRTARREANRALRVQEFLVRLFEGADPGLTRGETVSAKQVLEQGTKRIESDLADQPEVQISLYDTLARIHRKLGALDESERLARSAIALAEGPHADPRAGALARLALAETLGARFDFSGSRREVEAVLPRLIGDHGADSEPVARAREELAGALPQTGGSFTEALRYAEEAHAYYRKRFGDEHPQTARRLALVAILLSQVDRFAESEEAFARAAATLDRTLGAENPEAAEVRRYYAAALDKSGKSDQAAVEMERAVADLEKSLGPTHPTVARGEGSLAAFYSRHGRLAEAEPLLRRCASTLHGQGSREEGDCLRMLGQLLVDSDRAAEAVRTLEGAVAVLGRGDPQDPYLLYTLATLGRAQSEAGDVEAGEAVLRDAIARSEKLYGPEGDPLRGPLLWLGKLELDRGRVAAAVATLRRALAVTEKHRGASSTAAAKAAESLATALLAAGKSADLAEAARLVDRATTIYRAADPAHARLAPLAELAARIDRATVRVAAAGGS
jgi:serine/threonine-protein kinase